MNTSGIRGGRKPTKRSSRKIYQPRSKPVNSLLSKPNLNSRNSANQRTRNRALNASLLGTSDRASGIIDDAIDKLRGLVPYYNEVKNVVDHPFGRKVLKHIPYGKEIGKYVFDIGEESVPMLTKKVNEVVKEEKKILSENLLSGPSQPHSFSRTPKIRKGTNGASILSGGELYSVLSSGSTDRKTGDLIIGFDINPAEIALPLMKKHVSTAEQYRFVKLAIHLVGGSGNNTAGTFVMCYDPDPTDQWPTENAHQRASSCQYKVLGRPFDVITLRIPTEIKGKNYVDNEPGQERFESIGLFNMVVLNPIAPNVSIGSLYIEYEIELFSTQSDPDVISGDFYATKCTGSYTSTNMMDLGVVAPKSSISLSKFTLDEAKAGTIPLPSGNYRVSVTIGNASNLTHSGSSILSLVQNGKYAPWEDSYYKLAYGLGGTFTHHCWCGCLSDFSLQLNMTGGTWTSIVVWISATTATPFTSTSKGLMRLQTLLDSTSKDKEAISELKESLVSRPSALKVLDEQWVAVENRYLSSSSTSSSSSSYSLSSSSGQTMVKPKH